MPSKYTPQSLARQFCQGTYVCMADAVLWQQTFAYLARLPDDAVFQKPLIAALWARYGGDLRALIKNDTLVLSVLKRALPHTAETGQTVYRGESWFLFDQHQIGFCWSSSKDVATRYAKGLNAVDSGGVLLTAYAPPAAILGMHDEVFICDPSELLRVSTLALYPKL